MGWQCNHGLVDSDAPIAPLSEQLPPVFPGSKDPLQLSTGALWFPARLPLVLSPHQAGAPPSASLFLGHMLAVVQDVLTCRLNGTTRGSCAPLHLIVGSSGVGKTYFIDNLAKNCCALKEKSTVTFSAFKCGSDSLRRSPRHWKSPFVSFLCDLANEEYCGGNRLICGVIDQTEMLQEADTDALEDARRLLLHTLLCLKDKPAVILVTVRAATPKDGITAVFGSRHLFLPEHKGLVQAHSLTLTTESRQQMLDSTLSRMALSFSDAEVADWSRRLDSMDLWEIERALSLWHMQRLTRNLSSDQLSAGTHQALVTAKTRYEVHSPPFRATLSLHPVDHSGSLLRGFGVIVGRDDERLQLRILLENNMSARPCGILVNGRGGRFLVRCVLEELSRPYIILNAADIFKPLVGAIERTLADLTALIVKAPETVLVFQDIDRWLTTGHQTTRKALTNMFTEIEWGCKGNNQKGPSIVAVCEDSQGLDDIFAYFTHHLAVARMSQLFFLRPDILQQFIDLYLAHRHNGEGEKISILGRDLLKPIVESVVGAWDEQYDQNGLIRSTSLLQACIQSNFWLDTHATSVEPGAVLERIKTAYLGLIQNLVGRAEV